MLNFNSILLFSQNPQALADFYAKVFDKLADQSIDQYYMFNVGASTLVIGPHDAVSGPNPNPQRVQLNFETADLDAEVERIQAIPATIIKEPYNPQEDPHMTIATFADPDGNYFQLMTPQAARPE
jgi:predicted enzyme related to lactoylglutathione lyase